MNKAPASRRQVRRTAWWVAFAALAGFLLADLTWRPHPGAKCAESPLRTLRQAIYCFRWLFL